MKAAELRQKDVAGVEAEVKELQKAHFGLRMQKGTQQLNIGPRKLGENGIAIALDPSKHCTCQNHSC